MSAKYKIYSQEIWDAIRQSWECTPKNVGWKVACAYVSDQLKCEVPSESAVLRRAKKEGWKKRSMVGRKFTKKKVGQTPENEPQPIEETEEKTEQLLSVIDSEIDGEIDSVIVHENAEKHSQKLPKKGKVKSVYQEHYDLAVTNRQVGDVVRAYRRKTATISDMTDNCMDAMLSIQDRMSDVTPISPEEQEDIGGRLRVIVGMVELVETLSKTVERTGKMDFGLYGVQIEDFRDKQTGARQVQFLELDDKLEKAKQATEAKRQEMLERLAAFRSEETGRLGELSPITQQEKLDNLLEYSESA